MKIIPQGRLAGPVKRQPPALGKMILALLAVAGLLEVAYPADTTKTFQNPVIPGFHPDPSICRVGGNYYLVNSSFEYFPGVPIFQSRDLVHWKQIGYCLTRTSQLNLDHARDSGGIYAPTLRYHDGTFYMITTLVDTSGNFFVTAKNPAGPWSDPVWVDHRGVDPSLFFDDDGTVYYTRHEGMGDGYIGQAKIDLPNGKLEGPLKEIWKGTGGVWPEGPHLYKIQGKYYLMIAEGGTSYGHMENIARSDSPGGPFAGDPANPILTHRDQPEAPIQATGHADMVETPDGWWMVCLGIRPQGGQFHHLGRETFLTSVAWNTNGWPVVRDVQLNMPAPDLPQHPWKAEPARDNFDSTNLQLEWNFLRNPHPRDYSLTERPGYLRLWGSAVTMNDVDSPAFVGRRQTALACRAATRLSFDPRHENEEAGLVVRGNSQNHYDLGITFRDGQRQVFIRKVLDGKTSGPVRYEPIEPGDVILSVQALPLSYEFFYQSLHGPAKSLGTALTRNLSSEKIDGFTGVYIGMYATGNGQTNSVPADFDWFEYRATKQK
ncbi:MAG: glycoside hydrolase family 43 protein [Verrucomicrobiia bacterium]